jgi:hypothetical protein
MPATNEQVGHYQMMADLASMDRRINYVTRMATIGVEPKPVPEIHYDDVWARNGDR